ncbi:AraC family transcriptional regulator [Noviherbaspirillum pedocola]|uniref:AraC family transcriptional regulator n=1 Tax=Noviherbaspirillum pedocola TaxID=2801341 RepID=A0A934W906_9BURK|nr:AraC family transcriptional regulator [Noviherbaspirillum pedocola]MBK4739287.1 AraC family transcriptional regulator [Noviherbaspirillum pedocola]
MEKGNISIYFVHSALEPIIERGLNAEALLRRAGISSALLQSPQSRVTAQNFSTLWLGVARELDDELFAQDSRRMKVGSFAMLCQLLIHCDTLNTALLRMARFFNLILDDFYCNLETDAQHAFLTIREQPGPRAPRVFGYETLLMMQHGLACWLVGRRIPVLASAFAYPEPSRSAEYHLMYSAELRFNEEATSLMFDKSYLDLPVIQNERTVKDFIRQAPSNIVMKYKNAMGLSAQIRRRLRTAARTEWPEFDDFAQSLNMTPSTLRRRLEDEGQSFREIKDQLRRDIAIDYLCHTGRSIADIATELGFAETSAFHRAFKKWTGSRPGEYRQRMVNK